MNFSLHFGENFVQGIHNITVVYIIDSCIQKNYCGNINAHACGAYFQIGGSSSLLPLS